MQPRRNWIFVVLIAAPLVLAAVSCAPEYRPWWLGGTSAKSNVFTGVTGVGGFSDYLLDGRTFADGQAVTTVTHLVDDMDRLQYGIDFNRDGKIDPVTAYGTTQGVIQILLSYGDVGTVNYVSLTLDGGENSWPEIQDVAVGDIDGDGNLDLVAATQDGVVYLRHPSDADQTHVLRDWGAETGDLELIDGSTDQVSTEEQVQIIQAALGAGADLDDYTVTVDQGYTNVELGDVNNDGALDIVASRRLRISVTPDQNASANLEPLVIVAGSLQVLYSPGTGATTGVGWITTIISQHERHEEFDREGATGLALADLDDDGDLDIVSAAEDDINAQVAWFENPGGPGPVDVAQTWTQYRIGSLRGALHVDVADLTGDGRLDVVASSEEQLQIMLFMQPSTGPDRAYDWDSAAIVTFENFAPIDLRVLDVDHDGSYEVVTSGTSGTVRYFDPPAIPVDEWTGHIVTTFDPPGDVGLLGYGDLDGDGDLDLVAVVDNDDDNDDQLVWIRNELLP